MVGPVDEWIFDSARQAGDTVVVHAENDSYNGYHLLYFIGVDDEPYCDYLAQVGVNGTDAGGTAQHRLQCLARGAGGRHDGERETASSAGSPRRDKRETAREGAKSPLAFLEAEMEERLIRTEMLLGAAAMGRLARAHVAVFGLGGVGSWCAEALARCGVGALTLIDEDTVAESKPEPADRGPRLHHRPEQGGGHGPARAGHRARLPRDGARGAL